MKFCAFCRSEVPGEWCSDSREIDVNVKKGPVEVFRTLQTRVRARSDGSYPEVSQVTKSQVRDEIAKFRGDGVYTAGRLMRWSSRRIPKPSNRGEILCVMEVRKFRGMAVK